MVMMLRRMLFLLLVLSAVILSGCGSSMDAGSGKVYFLIHNDTGNGFNEDLKQALLAKPLV